MLAPPSAAARYIDAMTNGSTARLFIALLPNDGVRDELATWRDAWKWPRSASPVRSEKLHVTLHFIGDVGVERLPELGEALRVPFAPFLLTLSHTTLWTHGIAVLEPERIPDSLAALHQDTREVLQRIGLPVDARTFRPHVTLARRAKGAVVERQADPVHWLVQQYALMSSALATDGTYTALRRYQSF
jgi:2'-5' RNA ligase